MKSAIEDVRIGRPPSLVNGVSKTEHRTQLKTAAADTRTAMFAAKANLKVEEKLYKAALRKNGGKTRGVDKTKVADAKKALNVATKAYVAALKARDKFLEKNRRK